MLVQSIECDYRIRITTFVKQYTDCSTVLLQNGFAQSVQITKRLFTIIDCLDTMYIGFKREDADEVIVFVADCHAQSSAAILRILTRKASGFVFKQHSDRSSWRSYFHRVQ